jgi:hypothetical protein
LKQHCKNDGKHAAFYACKVRHRTRKVRQGKVLVATTCKTEECGANIDGLKSPFEGLRFHDLRHEAITELAEQGVPE